MNTLDLLTRKLSHQLIVSESLIDKLITFQWKETRAALEDETITSVEMTNLGSFLIRGNKLKKDIHKFEVTLVNLNNELASYTDEEDIVRVNKKIKQVTDTLTFLLKKQKAYEAKFSSSARGVEK